MVMKILLTIAYNGKNYVGWQKQKKGISIQEKIEQVLTMLFDEKIDLCGSGRTDAGVHALAQTASFDVTSQKFLNNFTLQSKNKLLLNTKKLIDAINANLPEDINIINAKEVKKDFHARYDVKKKIYEYHLQIGKNPFTNNLVGTIKTMPNINLMKEASKHLVGTYNFKSFCSANTETKTFVRTINYIKIYMIKKNEIIFELSGNGFLYNMVRIIVGTLVDVGLNKISPEKIKEILLAEDRTKAGKTFSPSGLYLKKVIY